MNVYGIIKNKKKIKRDLPQTSIPIYPLSVAA